MASRRWLGIVVLLVLSLAGVWIGLQSREGADATVVQLFKYPEDVAPFTMTDLEGHTLSSANLRGKVVIVNFWATWCTPCRVEIPDLIALQKKYQDNLVVIGVSEDEIPVEQVKQFADAQGMNYPVVMTSPEIRKVFTGVAALPTTFVLDRDGRLVQRHVGILNRVHTEAETRVLAGLDINATIEHVENDAKIRLQNAAQAKAIPGIDMTKLGETQKQAVMQALLVEECTCGCALTLAVCRLDDPTCPVSLPLAEDIVKKYSATP